MIGILGGTFDPIHNGHLRTALDVAHQLKLAQVRFIPCGQPPHREPPHASAQQRLAMVQAAVAEYAAFVADDRELRRDGPSYMVDTLSSLRQEFADTPLALILGLDAFSQLDHWHHWLQLIELSHIVVMTRPGWSEEDIKSVALQEMLLRHKTDNLADCHQQTAGKVLFCPVTPLAISSTAIREALRHGSHNGKTIRDLIPDCVYNMIEKEHIYT